jgi:predicted DNA-binding transcriptional regulator AlpA
MTASTASARQEIPDALRNFDSLPDCAHVRLPTVCALLGVGPATVWRRVKSGQLHAPTKLGRRIAAFNVGALRADLAALSA